MRRPKATETECQLIPRNVLEPLIVGTPLPFSRLENYPKLLIDPASSGCAHKEAANEDRKRVLPSRPLAINDMYLRSIHERAIGSGIQSTRRS
jgi:hypothetical protein